MTTSHGHAETASEHSESAAPHHGTYIARVTAVARIRRWLSDHFWGAARLEAAGDSVYRPGGKGQLIEDLVVGGSQSEFPVEDEILRPLIDERRRDRQREDGAG